MQWQHESESKSESSKQGKAEDFAAASIAARIKTHSQRQSKAKQSRRPRSSLNRNQNQKIKVRGKQGKVERLAAASVAKRSSEASKAKLDALKQPPSQQKSKPMPKASKVKQSQTPCCRPKQSIINPSNHHSSPHILSYGPTVHNKCLEGLLLQRKSLKPRRECSCSCLC